MPKTPKNKTAAAASSSAKKGEDDTPTAKASAVSSPSAKKKSPSKTAAKKQPCTKPTHHTVSNSLDILVPSSLGNATGECTVLVELHPDDAALLDFEGSTGAIGRFQVDSEGIVLDLKGSQYRGSLVPGPTAMIASLQYSAEDHTQQLRLETIVDEFCPLVKTQDTMAILDGHVEGTMDASYQLQEEDVNILARQEQQQQNKQQKQTKQQQQQTKKTGKANQNNKNDGGGTSKATTTKKRTSTGSASNNSSNKSKTKTTGNKRQKVSLGRTK